MLGIIELPVENASATRTNPNRGFDHHVTSSASRLRWTIPSAIAAIVSIAKSRSETASSEFAVTPSKPSSRGRGLAIERVAGAGQRARTERRDVEPRARIGQPATVALGHLDVGEQVMGEQHRLGRLDVGRAGQDGRPVTLGEADQRPLEVDERGIEVVDRPARPQPQVGGDLVVPRAARVESTGQRPDLLGQRRLDVHVDVFERRVPRQPTRGDVAGQCGQPVDEGLRLLGATGSPRDRARGRGRSSPRCRRPRGRRRSRSSA